jgi:hypothetical protein
MGFLDDLRHAVDTVSTSPADLAAAAVDRSGATPDRLPLAVVRAFDVDEVQGDASAGPRASQTYLRLRVSVALSIW